MQNQQQNPLTTLYSTLHNGLSELPGIQYCGFSPQRRDQLKLPAICLDMVELEPGEETGTNDLELITHWEAHVLVSQQQSKLVLWQLVQAILFWLKQYQWSENQIGSTQIVQASPDRFNPDLPGEQLWQISWRQALRINHNFWTGEDVIIDTLFVSYADGQREIIKLPIHHDA